MYGLGVQGESLSNYESVNMQTVRRAIDIYANEDARRKVRFKSFIAPDYLPTFLSQLGDDLDDAVVNISQYDDHTGVELQREIVRSDIEGGSRTVSGEFAIFHNDGTDIWTALTGHSPDFYKRGIIWFLKQARPKVSDFYVTSEDLEAFFDHLQQTLSSEADIRVRKAIAYTHRDEGTISFETLPYEEVFRVSRENNKYVDQVKFSVERGDGLLFSGFLSRDGQSRFISGDVSFFFRSIINEYCDLGQAKADLLKDQERSIDTGEIHQLEINFDDHVFLDPNDNFDLIRALSNLPNSGITVYHRNPYAHLAIVDYIDGSSIDVVVTDSNRISLIPSYQGSLSSLMRVSEQISKEFDEGTVSHAQETETEFAEFFAD